MENRKDIGKAYKEKLEGYTPSPSNHLWESIEAELSKSERKAFPIWKTLAGLGILILLLSTIIIYSGYSDSKNFELNPTTDNNTLDANGKIKDNAPKAVNDGIQNNRSNSKENSIVVSISTDEDSNSIGNKNSENTNSRHKSSNDIFQNDSNCKAQPSNKVNSSDNEISSRIANKLEDTSTKKTISNLNRNRDDSKTNAIGQLKKNNDLTNQKATSKTQNNLDDVTEFDIYSVVMMDELPAAKLDNKFDIDKKKKQESKHFKKSFRLSSYLLPALSNASSDTSPIDQTLDNSKKTSGFNINYDVALAVSLSKKSSLRIGVGAFNQSILTENADMVGSNGSLMNSPGFSNINLNSEATNAASEVFSPFEKLDLKQTTKYLETYIDYSFKLFGEKKIALYASSGVSALFLLNDSIVLRDSDGNSIDIGKAH